jgi:hypothetical protein
MSTSKQVKSRFAKIVRLASDGKGSMEYQTEGNGENPGSDSVSKENANTGERSYGNAPNQTSGDREHQYSVEEQNANQRQR